MKQMLEPDPKLRLTAKQVLGIFHLFLMPLVMKKDELHVIDMAIEQALFVYLFIFV